MYCKKCGQELPPGASFCPKCAAPVEQSSKSTYQSNKKSGSTRKPPFLVRLIVTFLAFCVGSFIAKAMFQPKKPPPPEPAMPDVSQQIEDILNEELPGEWVMADEDDLFSGMYIFKLDSPIKRCKSFKIDYEAEVVDGPSCNEWVVCAQSYGEWTKLDVLHLVNGKDSKMVILAEPMHIDAIVVYPDSEGELTWRDEMKIYNVRQASADEVPDISYEAPAESWAEGEWTAEDYNINDTTTGAFRLKDPIINCTRLKIAMEVEMRYNTSCEDWTVYTRIGSTWEPIGSIYLPGGNGDVETEIWLNSPTTIREVAIIPKIAGSYSWGMAIGVCDMS